MSHILDALKKSEQERKLGDLPDISSEHALLQEASERTPWLWYFALALGLLIFLALSLLAYQNYGDSETGYPQSTTQVYQTTASERAHVLIQPPEKTAVSGQQAMVPADTRESQSSKVQGAGSIDNDSIEGFEVIRPSTDRREALKNKELEEAEREQELINEYQAWFNSEGQNANSSQNITEEKAKSDQQGAQIGKLQELENQKTKQKVKAYDDWKSLPSIAALPSTFKQQIPSLKVSTHIYSSAASFRKVTINGDGAKVGDEISQGLVLDQITEEGVVLSFKGKRFRMNALEAWDGQ